MNVIGERITQIVDKILKLEDEKKAISDDISEVYKEAKSHGLVPKVIRKIVADEKKGREKVREERELLELYEAAMNKE